ncbi:MAG TPA: hypothetical protein VIC84_00540 [Blastocatellia bacterium]|jgi:hypothetical protein
MITPIKWNEVRTNSQWIETLATILGDCEDGGRTDPSERLELQTQLRTFVERSPSRVSALDEIALQASTDIMLAEVTERIAEIGRRNADLTAAAGDLGVQIEAANRDAGRVLRITAQLNKAIEAIAAVRDMVARLESDNANADEAIQAVLDGLGTLAGIFRPESG